MWGGKVYIFSVIEVTLGACFEGTIASAVRVSTTLLIILTGSFYVRAISPFTLSVDCRGSRHLPSYLPGTKFLPRKRLSNIGANIVMTTI